MRHIQMFPALIRGGRPDCNAAAGVFLILFALSAAALLGSVCAKEFRGNRKKSIPVFAGISFAVTLALLCVFGCTDAALRGILLCLSLLYASYSDLKTRECGYTPALVIAVTALIGTGLDGIWLRTASAFIAFALLFFGAVITVSTLNGADLLLSMACFFLLGIPKGLAGLCLGMLAGIVVSLIKKRGRSEGFPLLPYLAAGFMTAYFI